MHLYRGRGLRAEPEDHIFYVNFLNCFYIFIYLCNQKYSKDSVNALGLGLASSDPFAHLA